jgi:hypothetical protein
MSPPRVSVDDATDPAALVRQVRAAFADVVYPGDDRLTNSMGDEPDALREDFRGRDDWTTLDVAFLNQAPDGWGSALSFFSGEALRFYLPAYLVADLEGTLMCGDPSYRLCAFVTPMMEGKRLAQFYGGGTLGEHARREFSLFDAAQVAVIVDYLWWKLEQGDDPTVEQALENYWLPRQAEHEGRG